MIQVGFSLVAMAIILENPEERLETRREIADFALPVTIVLNKNGTAIFICSSILFIAEFNNIPLDVVSVVVIG